MQAVSNKTLVYFDFVTHYGGAQRSTILLCKELAEDNDVYVIDAYGVCQEYVRAFEGSKVKFRKLCSDSKNSYIGSQNKPLLRVLKIFMQIPHLLKLRRRLKSELDRIDCDLIWTNHVKSLFSLYLCGAFQKYPVVMFARRWYRRQELNWFKRQLVKKVDGVLPISNAAAEAMQQWGVEKEKIYVVYIAIDFDKVQRDSLKELDSLPPGYDSPYKIILPGQLIYSKGQIDAIETARLLKERNYEFVLWLAGDIKEGASEDYPGKLRALIQRYQLEKNVFMLGHRSDVRSLMRHCDLVFLPTHGEGLGRVIVEAMAMERPVVATAAGGVLDLVIHGKTGLLAEVSNAEQLADSVEKIMNNSKLRDTLVQDAKSHLFNTFTLQKHVGLVKQAFDRIIKSSR